MKKLFVVLLSISLSTGFVFSVYAAGKVAAEIAMPEKQQQSLGIRVVPLVKNGQMRSKQFPAEITVPIAQERIVTAPQSGLLDTLYVAAGQEVQKGQAIAHISSPELVNLQREYLQAKSQHGLNQKSYNRDSELFKDGIIAQRRYLETEAATQSSDLDVAQKKQALKLAGMSDATIARLKSPSDMQSGITLTAPITGQVLEQLQTVGARVDMAMPVYRIGRLNPLWAEIHVPMESLPAMKVGMPVTIPKLNASGKLIAIVRSVNKTDQTLHLRAEINQGAERLSPGQFVEAEIQLQDAQSQTAVAHFSLPKSALVRQGRYSWIFVQTKQGFQPLQVNVLSEQGEEVVLDAALQGNEYIATAGTAVLKGMWLGIGAD